LTNVLVVGGAGYVGGAVTTLLTQEGYSIRVYDNLLYENEYLKPIDFVFGDILDRNKLMPHVQWADTIIWFAAVVGDHACRLNPDLTVNVNEKSVKHLADNFNGKIIFTSTCSVYGAQHSIIDETAPLKPLSLYAVTKAKAEEYLKDKEAIIFRLGTLFGLSDNYSRIRTDLVVNTLTARAFQNRKITVFGGDQFRPLLHVKDSAQAIVDNVESNHIGAFNLHQVNLRIIDLVEKIKKHFPDLEVTTTDVKFEDDRTYQVTSEKARRTFNFSPRFSVDDGIKELKQIFEKGRIKNIYSKRYSNVDHLTKLNNQSYTSDAAVPDRT
jgi:nucleoside-diphosphate-sugar epimerase